MVLFKFIYKYVLHICAFSSNHRKEILSREKIQTRDLLLQTQLLQFFSIA